MKLDDSKSIYSISIILLYLLKSEPTYSTVSQLALLLDSKNFNKMIDYFGGLTIKIPTREELNSAIRSLTYYQEHYLFGKTFKQSVEESGISQEEIESVESNLWKLSRFFSKVNEDYFKNNDKF